MNNVIRKDSKGGRGMKKTSFAILGAFILLLGVCSADAFADQEWIREKHIP
jgi:hypothetical protein